MSASAMNRLAAIFFVLAMLAVGAAALSRLAQQPKFQLKRVDVRGDLRHVTAASVRTALAGRLRGNYFTMRLDDTRRCSRQCRGLLRFRCAVCGPTDCW
jgi:cell division protein FtsQ